MMAKTLMTAAATLLAAAPLAMAVGNARVVNNCSDAVTLWSVGQAISDPVTLASAGGLYSEPFVKDPVTGGKALKITKDPNGLYNGDAQTDFSYSLTDAQVWYDLSDVFGDAFAGSALLVASADSSCPTIDWSDGTPLAGSQTKVCGSDSDVTLTLCAA